MSCLVTLRIELASTISNVGKSVTTENTDEKTDNVSEIETEHWTNDETLSDWQDTDSWPSLDNAVLDSLFRQDSSKSQDEIKKDSNKLYAQMKSNMNIILVILEYVSYAQKLS